MKRVYICSPLAGDVTGNIEKAKEYCREAVGHGALPLAAHVYFTQFLDDHIPAERETGMQMGLELLELCEEVWVYGDTVSSGMAREIALAEEMGLPVINKMNMEGMESNEEKHMADCDPADSDMSEHDSDGSGFSQQL